MTSLNLIVAFTQNDGIDVDAFTFDKFFQLYHLICPRLDIEDLFKEL